MEAILFFNNRKRKGNQSVRKRFPFGLFITSNETVLPILSSRTSATIRFHSGWGDFYGIKSKKVMTFAESNPKKLYFCIVKILCHDRKTAL